MDESSGTDCPKIITRTYQIADLCGNLATCTQTITVDDEIPPTITCPPSLNAVCDILEIPSYANFSAFSAAGGTATDNCDIDPDSFTLLDEASDNNSCPETVTRTYQIADLCGNTATCTQSIIIHDLTAPTISSPDALTAVCDISEQPPYETFGQFTAAGGAAQDNCSLDEGSFAWISDASDGQSCPETVTRTYQIADLCGNISTCTQTITINDEISPTVTCPGSLTTECDISQLPPYADYAAFIAAGGAASDNCGIDQASLVLIDQSEAPGDCPKVFTRTYQIADLCGNTSTCTQTITVNDEVPPVINCPGPIEEDCDIAELTPYPSFNEFVAAGGSASDNCSINENSFMWINDESDGEDCPKLITRTYQIADDCGNIATCTQMITIDDQTPPVLTCPGNLTAACSITEQTPYSDYDAFLDAGGIATDNCGIDIYTFTYVGDVSNDESCPEIVTRTYQIADLCGNITSCTQTITVHDLIDPTITSPDPLSSVCNISEQPPYTAFSEFTAAGGTASDNCNLDEDSFTWVGDASDGQSCPETITRTYQISDLCGNISTCTQTITINDEIPPTVTCPGPLTAECDIAQLPPYADYAAFIAAGGTASDNCGIDPASLVLIDQSEAPGDCPKVYTRTYQIADLCGNTATCTQTITVNDEVPPVIICPGPIEGECDIAELTPYPSFNEFVAAGGSASDNCSINENSFMWINDESDGEDCPKLITRTYQIADDCGNIATCTQMITIDDQTPPVLTCPGNLTAACSITEQTPYSDYDAFLDAGGIATDNCGIDIYTFTYVGDVSNDESCPEIVTRTYQIADLCGNITSCTQTITVHDLIDPTITCPIIIVDCAENIPLAYASLQDFQNAGGIVSDNCEIDPATFVLVSEIIAPPGPPSPYQILREYSISDLCGNSTTCLQAIDIPAEPWANAGLDAEICSGQDYTVTGESNMATVEWTTSGTGTFIPPGSLTTTYTPSPEDINLGTVTLTLTAIAGGDCENASDEMVLTIWPDATANAGGNDAICEGETYTLLNAQATNYTTINWSSSGTGSFDAPHALHPTYTPSAGDISNGSVILTIEAVGTGTCPPAVSSMTLTITGAPTVNAGADADMCTSEGSITLSGMATNYESVLWTTGGTGTFVNGTTLTPTYTPSPADITAGIVTLTLTAFGNGTCGDAADDMTLTIWRDATAYAGGNAGICEGESYTLINADAANYSTINWSSSGTGSFDAPHALHPTYTPSAGDISNGSVILTLSATGEGPCPEDSDSMILTITGAPTADAGPDAEVCEGESYLLTGTFAENYSEINWSSSGTGSFDAPHALDPTYTPSAGDISTGTVTLTLTAVGIGTCGNADDTMILTIWPSATAFAGSDDGICGDEAYALVNSDATNYTTINWSSTGTGTFDDPNALHPTYTPSAEDIISGAVTITLIAEGEGDCPPAQSSMILSITDAPTVNAGYDEDVCSSVGSVTITGTATNYSSILWTTTGNGTFVNPASLTTTYTLGSSDIAAGQVFLTLTATGYGACGEFADAKMVTIWLTASADAGPDASVCGQEPYLLSGATADNFSMVHWTTSGTGTFDNYGIVNPTYLPGPEDVQSGSVILEITAFGAGGCPNAVNAMTLTITGPPVVNAGNDASTCTSIFPFQMQATADNYASLLWTTQGDGSFDDPTVLAANYTPGATEIFDGYAILTLTAEGNSSCPDASDEMVLYIWIAATADAGPGAAICEGESYTLSGATAADYNALQWATSGTGSFNDITILNPIYTPDQGDIDIGSVVLTLTATGDGDCPPVTDQMTLSITGAPVASAGDDASICSLDGSYTLSGNAENYYAIQWVTSGTGTFDDETQLDATYTLSAGDIQSGMVTLTLQVTGNGSCGMVSDAMSLAIYQAPTVYAGADATICAGNTYTITDASVTGQPSIYWNTSGDGTFDVDNILNPTYTPGTADLAAGAVTLTLTGQVYLCPPVSDAMILTLQQPVIVDVTISASEETVCEGTAVTFTATPVNGGINPVYAWYVNGIEITGETGATFTYTPGNGDDVYATLLSDIECSTNNPATSNTVEMTVNAIVPVDVTLAADQTTVCEGTVVTVTATPVNGGDNPVYSWYLNGNLISGQTGAIYTFTPANNDNIYVMLQSDAPCTSNNPATSNVIAFTVIPSAPVSVSLAASANPVCSGTDVTFTAIPVNEGPNPVYTWYVNGAPVAGVTGPVYTYQPADGDNIYVTLLSDEPCATGSPAESDPIVMTVNPDLPVSVTLTASENPVCAGTDVMFTATPVNGGTTPVYTWYVNGNVITGESDDSYTYMPANGDVIYVELLSSEICATDNPATSESITMTVNPAMPVQVTLAVSGNPVCAGTEVTFTATPVNGGTAPVYTWYVNDVAVAGESDGSYTYTPSAGDNIYVVLQSSEPCATNNPAPSNLIIMTVNPVLPVSVSLAVTANPVCSGTEVTYTATSQNEGTAPVYTWYLNGNVITGASGSTYTYTPVNGDNVYVKLFSNADCVTGNPATSNTIQMTVNDALPVSVTLVASENPVCAGTEVIFTATPVNGGTAPVYTWYVNDVAVAGESDESYSYTPSNGDNIYVMLQSSEPCATNNPAPSNLIIMTVNPVLLVSVSLAVSANPVCSGTEVTFTAAAENGGTAPVYTWYVNGSMVAGQMGDTYAYTPLNGDEIYVTLLSNEPCTTGNPATSETITMTVNDALPVSVTITVDLNPVCVGTQVVFTATPVNGGADPVYAWFVNNNEIIGQTGATFIYTPDDGDVIYATLNSSEPCATGDPATSNTIVMQVVSELPVSVTIVADANPVCEGTVVTYTAMPVNGGQDPVYAWYVNNILVPGETGNTWYYIPSDGDEIYALLDSSEPCATDDPATSNLIIMTVFDGTLAEVSIVASQNPSCINHLVTFTATPVNGGTAPVYTWYVNGILITGETGATYSYIPGNGDAVYVTMLSNEPCVTGNPAISDEIIMQVVDELVVELSIVVDQNPVCTGTAVTFTATPVNGGVNPLYAWYVNGAPVPGATAATYTYVPVDGDVVYATVLSDEECTSGVPVASDNITMDVVDELVVDVSLSVDQNPVCLGEEATFTATPVNGGSNPLYTWFVNGNPVSGQTGPTYTYTPANNDNVYVMLLSDASCATSNPATSPIVIMQVVDQLPVSVSIVADQNPVCIGTAVTFTATPINGGANPVYTWYVNGAAVPGQPGASYSYTPVNGDAVYVVLLSDEACATGNPATSGIIVMNVVDELPLQVSITVDQNPVCEGSSATFTAVPVNGGTNPVYGWFVNGTQVSGQTSATFTYTPANGDNVKATLFSDASCATNNPASSNIITMGVTDQLVVSVQITADQNPVCEGILVNYAATQTNGGSNPVYAWFVNGVQIAGETGPGFSYAPVNNDEVHATLLSDEPCATNNPAISNLIFMVVNPSVEVDVSITANQNPVCEGTQVIFTAIPVNGGTNPVYAWFVNGIQISGQTGASYQYIPANGDQVYATLQSDVECATGNPAVSNAVTMTVNELLEVGVTITADHNPVCSGTMVMFTAVPVNGGANPVYAWYVNGVQVSGQTGATYSYAPANGDQVYATLLSSEECVTGNPAISNTVSMLVNVELPVAVAIAADQNPVCEGTMVTFTATPTNGGLNPVYTWYVNTIPVVGPSGPVYQYIPANGDVVYVTLLSDEACATGNPATSNPVAMTVDPSVDVAVTITADQNPVCEGTAVTFTATPTNGGIDPVYAWFVNGVPVSGQTGATYPYVPANGDQVTATLLSSEECAVNNPATSNAVDMAVNALLPVSLTIGVDQNPVCEGTVVTFTATAVNGGSTPVYKWFVDGVEVIGQTGPAYSFVPANGVMVHATVLSSEPCATQNPAISNLVAMVVLPEMEVAVTIAADQNPVCQGTVVTFTATSVNGGVNPVYAWFVNSAVITGQTQSTYQYAPADGDQVYATLLSDANCATSNPATSNILTMTVMDLVPVDVAITADHNPVCEGTAVTFTAVPVNGGSDPAYAWFVNGVQVAGQTTSTFTYVPAGNDVVHTTVLSDVACATNNPASSNEIKLEVTTKIVPSFASIGPLAQCSVPPELPLISGNNVTGTWDPATITTDAAGEYTYNFTPDEGQCATEVTLIIAVAPDSEPPAITCDDLYTEASAGNCSIYVDVTLPIVSDNCGVKTVSNDFNGSANASGYYPLGMTTVVWTVEDINGNRSTCHSIVTVVSNVIANDDYASTLNNVPVNIFILGNDLYCIGSNNPISVSVVEEPEHGLYFQSGDIRFLDYAPDFGFSGIDSLKYELCDYTGACDTATVYIIVEYFNQKPVAVDDLDSTTMNIPVVIDVLANDYDPDGRITNYEILAAPLHGASIKIMVDSTILYSPFNDFVGSDKFTYYIFDDGNPQLSDTATVYIEVFKKDILPEPPFIIYNALTPNGDGVNDYWKIKGIELYPNNSVVIMDRWGKIVAEIQHYDNGANRWDGLDKDGQMVPNGTYYYFLTISEYQSMYKGWVFLYRD